MARGQTERVRSGWAGSRAGDVNRPLTARVRRGVVASATAMMMASLFVSCGDNSVEPIGQPGDLTIQPASQTMEVGGRITLSVSADGATVPADDLFWSTNDEAVASVSSAGQVTAKAPGQARISASISGRSASSQITVESKGVRNVAITPLAGSVKVGGTLQMSVKLTASDGTELSGREVDWSSENTNVATVSSSGLVTGKSAGVSVIRATSEGVTGQAQVTVAAPVDRVEITPSSTTLDKGDTQQFSAVAYDSDDEVLSGRTATWSISPQSVATITSAGRVTAVSAGTAEVTATIEGKEATARVTVRPPAVGSVEVAPSEVDLKVGASQQFQATVRDTDGNVLTGRSVAWSISPESVASINSSGLVTAVSGGTATVTATVEGKTGSSKVTVLSPVVDRVEVTASRGSPMEANETRQLTATAYDENDQAISDVTFTWASSDQSIARVSSTGLVTAQAFLFGRREVTITATAPNDKSGGITIRVNGTFSGGDDDDDDGP